MSMTSTAGSHAGRPCHGIVERETALHLPGIDRWLRLLLRLAGHLDYGTVMLTLPDGPTIALRGRTQGPTAEIVLRDQRLGRRVLLRGGLGFAEAYMDGDFDTPDLTALLGVMNVNEALMARVLDGKWWMRALSRVGHVMNGNSRKGSRRNIAHHYDLGNEFYAAWLDPGMTYSAAVFDGGVTDLSAAQDAKNDLLGHKLGLGPDLHVLEIGCGWGGFAERAAKQFGARVTAVTISREQHDYARRRIFEAGLAEKVDIRLQDYRDIPGRFDRIASVEMFEAVGERYWPRFFGRVADLLKPDGRAALQVITIAEPYFERYRRHVDFIQKYVFPGGMLPSPTAFRAAAQAAGLRGGQTTTHGPDYARTLRLWFERFNAAQDRIRPLGFDERFRRLWNYYLCYCEAGFDTGSIDVMQTVLHPA
ncbi:SAM-dependent methyltransferase [Zavarzinia aquatilis]|uniref:SAM-dependent methyltransferase n=1 Tax=Zavarzinia aquatilis TaxID=2211142 RepID=A0A317DZR2_9PROT|nr:cyclopropane-fatty-acyl-phospholipid synthase family protein [Zavarzinia aquatilis]PWR18563.1 SAM-dependent methyltransferase [Zavarzinia aquatilis]